MTGLIETVYGVPITNIKELIDLFEEDGYDLKSKEGFKEIKRHYFKIVELAGDKLK